MENQTIGEAYKVRACVDQVYGPVPLNTLIEWVKDERVLADTWVFSESDGGWQKAENITRLQGAFYTEPNAQTYEEFSAEELRQFPQFAKMTERQLEQFRRFG